jgi:hypothetical protein
MRTSAVTSEIDIPDAAGSSGRQEYRSLMRKESGNMRHTAILILTIVLANSGFALTGSGTQQYPYLIQSLDDFNDFAGDPNYWDDHIRLEVDIDLAGRTYTAAVISPDIDPAASGFQGDAFAGSFDGSGRKILNLTIDTAGDSNDYLGLFGQIYGSESEVKNLGIENAMIRGGDGSTYIGSICGLNYLATVVNCYSSGSVSGGTDSSLVGGLCGSNYGTISDCYAVGEVTCGDSSDYIGGLCGLNYMATIINCYSSGSTNGGDLSGVLGGLCGRNYAGTISNCYSSGSVSGGNPSYSLGGLCGVNYSLGSIISNCYSSSSVSGYDRVGGLCGDTYYNAIISNCYSSGSVSGGVNVGGLNGRNVGGTTLSCYSSGSVSGDQYKGGFCGYQYGNSSLMEDCFWDVNSSGTTTGFNLDPSYPGTVTNVLGRTTDQMQTQNTFTDFGWDFVLETANGQMDHWYMPPSDYPRLWWQHLPAADADLSGVVDIMDLCKLCEEWLLADGTIPNYRLKCDLDRDGCVDLIDFAGLANCWLDD